MEFEVTKPMIAIWDLAMCMNGLEAGPDLYITNWLARTWGVKAVSYKTECLHTKWIKHWLLRQGKDIDAEAYIFALRSEFCW